MMGADEWKGGESVCETEGKEIDYSRLFCRLLRG